MKAIRLFRLVTLVLLMMFVISGCVPQQSRGVSRRDVKEEIDLSGRWNDVDSQNVAKTMILDALTDGWIEEYTRDNKKKPIVITYGVKNRTSEHINTQTFMKNLERALLRSRQVRIVASPDERDQIRGERADQQMGLTKNPTEIGRELGADFVLTGVINAIQDRVEGTEVIFYQVSLELINVESNEKIWIKEHKEKKLIRRRGTRLY